MLANAADYHSINYKCSFLYNSIAYNFQIRNTHMFIYKVMFKWHFKVYLSFARIIRIPVLMDILLFLYIKEPDELDQMKIGDILETICWTEIYLLTLKMFCDYIIVVKESKYYL